MPRFFCRQVHDTCDTTRAGLRIGIQAPALLRHVRALNKAMKERVATEAANRNVYEVARDTCKTPDGESPSGYKAEGSDIVPFKQWQKWYTEQSDGSTCVWQAWQKTAFEEQQAWQERLIAEDARMCNLNDL